MNLVINGEQRKVADVETVADLLAVFQIHKKMVVVELNRVIIERHQYNSTLLNEADAIEIVHFVGGG